MGQKLEVGPFSKAKARSWTVALRRLASPGCGWALGVDLNPGAPPETSAIRTAHEPREREHEPILNPENEPIRIVARSNFRTYRNGVIPRSISYNKPKFYGGSRKVCKAPKKHRFALLRDQTFAPTEIERFRFLFPMSNPNLEALVRIVARPNFRTSGNGVISLSSFLKECFHHSHFL